MVTQQQLPNRLSGDITKEIQTLSSLQGKRNSAFNEWYKLLRQDDDNEMQDMESFVSNDPRTLYNMALFLLTPRPPVFNIRHRDGTPFTLPEQVVVDALERYFQREWERINREYSRAGDGNFYRSSIGLLLITGHYFIPHGFRNNRPWVGYWNPAETFPEWNVDAPFGLSRLGRRLKINGMQAHARAKDSGWEIPNLVPSTPDTVVIEEHLFKWEPVFQQFSHAVVLGTQVVKQPTLIGRDPIPVVAGRAGGLPDNGPIDADFTKHRGESILATNAKVYAAQNRQHTFNQQMIRDTANPRWFEQSTGNTPILRPEDLFKRGAVFRGGLNDNITPLAVPPIPLEVRTSLFSVEGMISRGGFSPLTFGNVQQEVSQLVISQAAEAASQLVEPFHGAIVHILTDVTDSWWQKMITTPVLRPKWIADLVNEDDDISDIWEDTEVIAQYSIRVPGDLPNRVLMSKQMNPQFRLSVNTIYEMFFPEIQDVIAERAGVRSDDALETPAVKLATAIVTLQRKASQAIENDNNQLATVYQALAQGAMQQAVASLAQSGGLPAQQEAGPQIGGPRG